MSPADTRDTDFMGAALNLGRRGLGSTFPNPAVGCILVKDGHVIARGWTQPGGRPHAEAMALDEAGEEAQGATVYVTLEPCAHHGMTPPCAERLVKAGVARVVVGITDPDPRVTGKGLEILRAAGIDVVTDVCKEEAWRANQGFFLTKTEHRPMFTLKLATDAQGLIPLPDAVGEDKWITSPEARQRGHLLRAQHDAVVFGIGTVEIDNPKYTGRLPGMAYMSPMRVLLDSHLRLSLDSNLIQTLDFSPLWIMCAEDAQGAATFESRGITVIRAPGAKIEPTWVAQELAVRGLTRVLIESGPRVASSFLAADLVDEVAWFRSDRELGAKGVPAFHDNLMEKLAFDRQAVLQAGPDHLEFYTRKTSKA